MNKVIVLGNITNELELKKTSSGRSFVRFSIASNNGKDADGNERPADFIPCITYGKTATNLCKYKGKGDTIIVEGRWHSFTYEKDDTKVYGNDCVVTHIEYVGGAKEDSDAEKDSAYDEDILEETHSEYYFE